ncbi:hypothetical protein MTO96_026951 [Rhipicephalus appendiculatus]
MAHVSEPMSVCGGMTQKRTRRNSSLPLKAFRKRQRDEELLSNIDENQTKQQQENAALRAENAALKTQLKKYQRLDSFLKKAECLVEGLKGVARSRSLEFNDDEAAPPQKKHSGASNGETSTAQVSLSGALENSQQLSHSS